MAQAPGDDRDLVRQLAKGETSAFAACYERYQGPIFRFALHMSGSPTTAEEVTQEVFLRFMQQPRNFDPGAGSLGGYLIGIARNVLRRDPASGAEVSLGDHLPAEDDPALSYESSVPSDLDREQALAWLRRAVLALPPTYREALVLCELEELSYAEAATVLQCPPGTVASRLNRARAMLKLKFNEMGCLR